MIIPYQELDAETLNSVLESVVLRDGTDYGEVALSLEEKVAQLHAQLTAGTIVLVYSQEYESLNLLPAEQFSKGAR